MEIDGVIQVVLNDRARVVIKRMIPRPAPFAWVEGYTSRWVRAEEVLGVIEGEAMFWPDAARLKGVSDEREGIKAAVAPMFWTVGVEEIQSD